MDALTAAELAEMRECQVASLQDTCKVLAYSATTDDYGLPKASYTPGAAQACGFDPTSSREVQEGSQVAVVDARLRLPLGTVVTSRDRVQITHRFGEALSSPETYSIIGEPERGPVGLVLNLRTATDGT
jgi:hypothetical protein